MSLEKKLNLSNAKKPQIVDQADARRQRLMGRIENQIVIAYIHPVYGEIVF